MENGMKCKVNIYALQASVKSGGQKIGKVVLRKQMMNPQGTCWYSKMFEIGIVDDN